uniref:Uncharacterized protein n=1 Tax=Chrysemys picta bellii TaxID=8478 RepID=A0A8C3FU91_CHRPI
MEPQTLGVRIHILNLGPWVSRQPLYPSYHLAVFSGHALCCLSRCPGASLMSKLQSNSQRKMCIQLPKSRAGPDLALLPFENFVWAPILSLVALRNSSSPSTYCLW